MGLYQLVPLGPEAWSPPESFWEMENLGPHPDLPNQNLHFNKTPRWLGYTLNSEKHRYTCHNRVLNSRINTVCNAPPRAHSLPGSILPAEPKQDKTKKWQNSVLFLDPFTTVCNPHQLSSVVSDSATPWTAAHQASLSTTNSQSSPKLTSIEPVMPSNHLILCRPLLLLPSIFLSIRVFSLALHIRWPKYWSFSFNISPSNEHPGLISFRMDWLDLLAVQGTRKSLLQHRKINW